MSRKLSFLICLLVSLRAYAAPGSKIRVNCPSGTTPSSSIQTIGDDSNVTVEECLDAKGRGQGPFATFYSTGEKRSEGTSKDGETTGPLSIFNRNGTLQVRRSFVDGKVDLGVKNPSMKLIAQRFAAEINSGCNLYYVVSNDNPFLVTYWRIDAILYDASGNQIGTAYSNTTNLASKKSSASRLWFSDVPVDSVKSVKRIELRQQVQVLNSNEDIDVSDQFKMNIENKTNIKIEFKD